MIIKNNYLMSKVLLNVMEIFHVVCFSKEIVVMITMISISRILKRLILLGVRVVTLNMLKIDVIYGYFDIITCIMYIRRWQIIICCSAKEGSNSFFNSET